MIISKRDACRSDGDGRPLDVAILEPPQSVTILLQEEEVLAATEYCHSVNVTYQRNVHRSQRNALVAAGLLAAFAALIATFEGRSLLISTFLLVVSAGAFLEALTRRQRLRKINQDYTREVLASDGGPILTKEYRAIVRADGFEILDEDGNSFRRWKSISKVVRLGDVLLVFQSPLAANIIPSRAFRDEAAFEGYVALAKRLWSAAHVEPVGENGEVNV